MIRRILIAGGGTGGHIYPGIAVAEEVLARNPRAQVTFVGTTYGLEGRIVPELGYSLQTIRASRIKGGGLGARLIGVLKVPFAMLQSWRILWRTRPQVVLGVGGYASGPALLAAWMACYRVAIQEQNAVPGMTNRVLGKLARAVYVGFTAATKHFPSRKVRHTGNPLRRRVADALRRAPARTPAKQGRLRILVFGGSQGARFLNESVPGLVARVRKEDPSIKLEIRHQTGVHDEDATRIRYEAAGLDPSSWQVTPFIDDMASAYAAADMAITRAGALTVGELMAVGLPSLLVPFPYAADNHQEVNASVLVDGAAARMVTQPDWNEASLSEWLRALAHDPTRLGAMSVAARKLAQLDAASDVVDSLEELTR